MLKIFPLDKAQAAKAQAQAKAQALSLQNCVWDFPFSLRFVS